ncbi:TPA: ferredoxin [candidate division WWE3 bacterium]|uniref:Ferredoxin n=3 Tax=Katanobacteria TaxID=422282 RepID=A0A0G1KHN2_UNCKA|nr:MAG: hypothetical protein UW36_C0008G0011 [candidate division WWE3 bacterium GW2011_GWA2_44_16]KKT83068.1 MAG: hypothetical protein UW82_C0048G0002 [candidate division WWE3 bacterium GW2011_GWC2_44_9]HAZ29239.1 ferredoxin [candidate division WWE3 bacterium]
MTAKKIAKIVVDRKTCIGAATCIVVSPKGFDLDSENIAVVQPGALDLDQNELLMAAQSCPVLAITLLDEDGNQIYPAR